MKELLKFITCGSVDDGKSTLIGHMLYDSKLLFADQERALELESKVGSTDGSLDYSLLLDGLMAEREQGITIDVAYRYFTTSKRSFIVADTPGHEEYTRNMAVGASFADAAVILLDATKGVLVQTKRHTRICSLMGIRDFIFIVNKMDLADYKEDGFLTIKQELEEFIRDFPYNSMMVIPVSATIGDNITAPSTKMQWFQGPALLSYLEELELDSENEKEDFVLPIQRVSRPNHTFRGFQGQVEAGSLRLEDEITVYPSGEKASVSRLLAAGEEVEEVIKGQPVTVCLDREIDCSRGCVMVKKNRPEVGNMFQVTMLWMDDTPLIEGKEYICKLGTKKIPARIVKIEYRIDVNTGAKVTAEQVKKNEIVFCSILTTEKIVFHKFADNEALGGLILIDRITNMTSACGVIEYALKHFDNLTWQDSDITKEIREKRMGQRAAALWFTGLSGSGKSTLANALELKLTAMGKHTMLLDGDNIRMGLNRDLKFSDEDRTENIRRIAEVAKLMNDAGLIVLTSFISPFAQDRDLARSIIGDDFFEIYVSTPLEECERRDVKGLYKKARNGELPAFTGISSPYEPPEKPDVQIDTSQCTVEEAVDLLVRKLHEHGIG
ncbi:MAG: adenylyl-sulfate kinase [Bacteroides sp.]|nr:adenylyl-sulfate kinase [Bacteroides sp.]MCM1549861.1 adenylyl-sulfate kinase [Clostridium sp.]